MELGLQGKVVVITGGTAGIGKGFIPVFLEEGCKVAVCGRNEASNAALQKEYPDILVVRADVGEKADLEHLAAEAVRCFGGIDVWINNAGILLNGLLMEMPEKDWDTTMNINLKGVFMGTRIAVPYLEKRGGGVIINASSFATVIPAINSGAYAASKVGVNTLTQAFAAELAPKHIRVLAYIPGVIATPMVEGWVANGAPDLTAPIALQRLGQPEELAPMIVFMASEKAGYMTGSTVAITGGKFCVQNAQAVWR